MTETFVRVTTDDGLIAASTASRKASDRLRGADGRVAVAFEGLDLGWGAAEVREYLTPEATGIDLPAEQFNRLVGVCAAFAIVCVERDRERRGTYEADARRLRSQLAAIHRFTIGALEADG